MFWICRQMMSSMLTVGAAGALGAGIRLLRLNGSAGWGYVIARSGSRRGQEGDQRRVRRAARDNCRIKVIGRALLTGGDTAE
jgi:hypothetical protein